ncbi:hypothetical protein NC653_016277 [Populus alba x Populus x berolinensis]|uniref:Uncharacterized protein n=1 Tax=Populus alba x Populus x berolinensis TaxID=444605 RepID=A0AAD6VZ73_9ROSI|nr:hypothetical protein NC653_016277 [Populus alba x Populus x berolinensis]
MEKQGTCTTNSCTQRGRRIFLLSYDSSELVIHVPVFPIMITTTPSYIAPSRALRVGESPVQVLNPCMQKWTLNFQQLREKSL